MNHLGFVGHGAEREGHHILHRRSAPFDVDILEDLPGPRKIHHVCVFCEHKGDIDLSLWRWVGFADHPFAASSGAPPPPPPPRDQNSLSPERAAPPTDPLS